MSDQPQKILTHVFILAHQAEGDTDAYKVGESLPITLTWREAIQQQDGSYKVSAYNQTVGQQAEDITALLASTQTTFCSEDALRESFKTFDGAFSYGYHTYEGKINKTSTLTKEQIESGRVPAETLEVV